MTILSCPLDAFVFNESFTFTVKVNVPATVGLPEIAPVLALSVNPAGSAPLVTLQV